MRRAVAHTYVEMRRREQVEIQPLSPLRPANSSRPPETITQRCAILRFSHSSLRSTISRVAGQSRREEARCGSNKECAAVSPSPINDDSFAAEASSRSSRVH